MVFSPRPRKILQLIPDIIFPDTRGINVCEVKWKKIWATNLQCLLPIFVAEKSTSSYLQKCLVTNSLPSQKNTSHFQKSCYIQEKTCQIESDPNNRSTSRDFCVGCFPSHPKPGARNFHRGTDNTPVTPDERSAQINVSIDPRHPRGNQNKNNLKPKLTAVFFESTWRYGKKSPQKENSFPTTIFQGRTVKLSRSYNFHCGGCAEVLEEKRVHPLQVAYL